MDRKILKFFKITSFGPSTNIGAFILWRAEWSTADMQATEGRQVRLIQLRLSLVSVQHAELHPSSFFHRHCLLMRPSVKFSGDWSLSSSHRFLLLPRATRLNEFQSCSSSRKKHHGLNRLNGRLRMWSMCWTNVSLWYKMVSYWW